MEAVDTAKIADTIRELRSEATDTETMLRGICKTAVDSIPGTEHASVTIVTRGEIQTPVMVGDLAGKSDDLQRELHEGPCVRSAIDDQTIVIDDMSLERRWPRFAAAASELGIGSMLCFCLYAEDRDFGALNLIGSDRHGFDAEAISVGELFAAHCATTFSAVREKEHLHIALNSRDVIGQAKGMLMERFKIGSDDAFRLLTRLSQQTNVKLVDVATQLINAGPDS